MMAAGNIYHTSPLSAVASGWEALAENVGAGPSVDSLHAAFMASSGHRRNILGDYNYVGIGVSQSDSGQLWVTVIFMRKGAPAPAPTTTTTTTTTVAPAPGPGTEGHHHDGRSDTDDAGGQDQHRNSGSCPDHGTGSTDHEDRQSPASPDRHGSLRGLRTTDYGLPITDCGLCVPSDTSLTS